MSRLNRNNTGAVQSGHYRQSLEPDYYLIQFVLHLVRYFLQLRILNGLHRGYRIYGRYFYTAVFNFLYDNITWQHETDFSFGPEAGRTLPESRRS